jgi:hypothetical protein
MEMLAWIVLVLIHVLDVRRGKLWVALVSNVDHIAVHRRANCFVLPVENLHCGRYAVAQLAVCEFERHNGRRVVVDVVVNPICNLPTHVVRALTKVIPHLKTLLALLHLVA